MKKITAPLIVIFLIIALCSVLARIFSGSETLTEYAEKNPELAYSDFEKDSIIENQSQKPAVSHTNNKAEDFTGKENTEENVTGNISNEISGGNSMRTEYKNGFYFEPLSENIKDRITGISYPVSDDIQIIYDDLRYVSVQYYNFKGIVRTGELICNQAIAQDLVEIFYELYQNEYEIEQIHLIDEYGGDDTLSMQDNNTSCFNYRVVDGTTKLSKHALGLAIDINPFFNPYVVYKNDGTTYISPQGSETYADRSKEFAYKIDENDLCYRLFKEHGFTWGGDWNSMKDYQHFQKSLE